MLDDIAAGSIVDVIHLVGVPEERKVNSKVLLGDLPSAVSSDKRVKPSLTFNCRYFYHSNADKNQLERIYNFNLKAVISRGLSIR